MWRILVIDRLSGDILDGSAAEFDDRGAALDTALAWERAANAIGAAVGYDLAWRPDPDSRRA